VRLAESTPRHETRSDVYYEAVAEISFRMRRDLGGTVRNLPGTLGSVRHGP